MCYNSVDEILKRDKTSLDIFWIKDKSLADLDNLPDPDVLADDIIENLQSALESFQELKKQLDWFYKNSRYQSVITTPRCGSCYVKYFDDLVSLFIPLQKSSKKFGLWVMMLAKSQYNKADVG